MTTAAEQAVAYATKQLGKPYRYATAGPDTFDCSGLTMRAMQAAGKTLPHNAEAQRIATLRSKIAKTTSPPAGCLVFFGRGIAEHCGLSIGGGRMIEAPHTGDVVKVYSIAEEASGMNLLTVTDPLGASQSGGGTVAKLSKRAAFIQAVGIQESGGNYSDVNKGSGALGKYQVMPSNLASWTTQALGHPLTATDYLNDPAAQDAVANQILGHYYDVYGPQGAAAAWYAGPANHGLFADTSPQNGGPSIASYVHSVMGHMRDVLGGKVKITTSTNPGGTTTAAGSSAANQNPPDWIGGLNGILNPNIGGASLNPLKDASNVGQMVELVAARAGIAAVGLILFGAGLLVAFGGDIFGGAARRVPAAAPVADTVEQAAEPAATGAEHARELEPAA